ncbi:hypothetical protein SH1V18_33480 [Vallitalea longa]|uniref:DUF218 domain-containing protein n=1 Tax=Vallitalea longa TaxID=2936439 RepID=A0A9W5YGQ4_9FIRM|nr:YdcF family protein [Vallitalea longa]GKX30868.1 hypothetical protein SH1V18_33480 [Vallitalea longa]
MGILAAFSLLLGCFSILYFLYLTAYNAGAGFSFFWILVCVICFILHFIFKNYDTVKLNVPKVIRVAVFLFIIILLVVFLIFESFIVRDSMRKESYEETDYAIVLGAAVRGTTVSLTLSNRLEAAYEYIKGNNCKVILSGGQGPSEDITEAEAMKRYLIDKGIDEDRLIKEDQSSSTQENLKYSFDIINNEKDNASITIITSNYHVYRAKKIAEKYFNDVQGVPAKTLLPIIPHYYVREFFAVIKDTVF